MANGWRTLPRLCWHYDRLPGSEHLLTYLLHGTESFLRSQLVLQLVKKFPAFKEPESSLSYSQVPATCLYPEPAPSSGIFTDHNYISIFTSRIPVACDCT
jgi:hypothetical protein